LSYLEILSDIDTIRDTETIIDSFSRIPRHIKQLLLAYISVEKKITNSRFSSIETSIQALLFNKGSPALLHL
jgi:hypothetical protein